MLDNIFLIYYFFLLTITNALIAVIELKNNITLLIILSAVFGLEDGSGIIGYPANRYVVLQGNGKWI